MHRGMRDADAVAIVRMRLLLLLLLKTPTTTMMIYRRRFAYIHSQHRRPFRASPLIPPTSPDTGMMCLLATY